MITVDYNSYLMPNRTYYGLSTDEKPTNNIGNGSCFIEMDTGKAYFFDAENGQWLEA